MLRAFGLFLLRNWYVTTWHHLPGGALTYKSSHYPTPTVMTDRDLEKTREETVFREQR